MFSLDVNVNNFKDIVLEGSHKTPVVVDFWAPWCGPCKSLKPILEKLAEEYQGKFILAKINSDENQELAMQFGVRGIPSVKAVRDGKVVDEFSGALPEESVRQWLDKLVPSPAEDIRQSANNIYKKGDANEALRLLDEAILLDGDYYPATIDKASILAEQGALSDAKTLLDALPQNVKLEENVASLITKIDIAEKSQHLEDEDTLQQKIVSSADDLQARLDLANLYVSHQQYESAIEQLFEIIQRDRTFQDDVGRKTVVSIFGLLGNEGDLVRTYRRKLASLLN